ncbi:MAG: hypothetical protein QM793_06790 [Muricomes sp.]
MNLFKIFGTIAVNNSEANSAVDETADKADSASSAISGAFKKIGAAVATYFAVDKIKDFGIEIVNTSAEVSAEQSAFSQIMGDYSKQAQEKLKAVADATGMLDTRLTPYMTSMTAKFKGLGYGVDDATGLAQRGLTLAADASAFWDKSLDDSMGALNSFINGSYEGGEAIGLFANDSQLASYAVAQGIVGEAKEWSTLDEARKQATRLQYAEDMYKLSGATGQASKEANQYANVQANLTEKWRQFKAQIGEPILQNIVLPAMEKLSGVVDIASQKFEQAQPYIQEFGSKIISVKDKALELGGYAKEQFQPALDTLRDAFSRVKDAVQPLIDKFTLYVAGGQAGEDATNAFKSVIDVLADAVGDVVEELVMFTDWCIAHQGTIETIAVIIGSLGAAWLIVNTAVGIWNGLAAIATGVTTGLAGAVAFLTSPIGIAVVVIGTLIAIGVLLYKNWDTIKAKVIELWQNLSEKFNAIKESVSNAIEQMKQAVTDKINAMKQFVTDKIDALKTGVTDKINSMKDSVTNKIESMKQAASDKIESMKQTASNKFEQMRATMGNLMQNAKDNVSQRLENMKAAYQEKGGGMSGIVSATMTGIKDTYSSSFNVINDLTGGRLGDIVGKFRDGFGQARDTVSNIFDSIRNSISDKINAARDIVSNVVDRIKGIFDFSWSLPDLKLPHISVDGGKAPYGIAGKGELPSFSIDWYAKAMDNPMVLDSPTIFGYNPASGSFLGGGEAGKEIVAGASTLSTMIRDAVASGQTGNYDEVVKMLAQILDWLGNGGLKSVMIDILLNDVKLKWRDRELARLVREYA